MGESIANAFPDVPTELIARGVISPQKKEDITSMYVPVDISIHVDIRAHQLYRTESCYASFYLF